jgi:hypothetical protein
MIHRYGKLSGLTCINELIISCFLLISCESQENKGILSIKIYPDSLINDVSNRPVGINLNFFMDGGRFPSPEHTVTNALSEMGVRYLRYPGGEKSDLYLFSVPPYEESHPVLARTAGLKDYPGVISEESEFTYDPLDFDEYMEICRSLSAEPVVTVAGDNYLLEVEKGERVSSRKELILHAAAWVRYANINKGYGIKYWMIANESWNNNNPNSTSDIYAQDVIDFSRAMKAVDPSILIIPNGDSDEFFKTVITKAGDHIDRICVSNYGVYDFINGYDTYRDSTKILIWPAMTAIGAMEKYATAEQKERLKVIVSEFGSIDWAGNWKGTNDIGHTIVTFDMAGQLLLQPQIEFSCFWNTRWIENESKPGTDHDALDKEGNINPTGQSLLIWNKFLGDQMIKAEGTPGVIAYSSFSPDEGRLFVYLVNKTEKPETVSLDIENFKSVKVIEAWEYFGLTPGDMHPVWQVKEQNKRADKVDLKGLSITVLELNISR